jgi:2-methylcitrate dehydratase
MSNLAEQQISKPIDPIQQRLVDYACNLSYEAVSPEARHALKVRFIDTLGALFGGFSGAPCRIARDVAAQTTDAGGATIIGTRLKTNPELAAFANATAARYVEANDVYHWPNSNVGHPSDVLLPVFAAAEHAHPQIHFVRQHPGGYEFTPGGTYMRKL